MSVLAETTVLDGSTAVARLTGALPPMSLAQVLDRAELQTRVDRKYLVPADQCAAMLPRLAGEYAVLEIDGRRDFRYSSTYFDSPDLLTFRQHRQGRRQRYKMRTRTYMDSGECMFEVKLSGARNSTDKRRMHYDAARRRTLDAPARAFLQDVLLSAYRTNPPEIVVTSATTDYLRSTLVQLSGPGRVTFDTTLTCTDGSGTTVAADPGTVLIESKSAGGDAPVDRVLRDQGVRPAKISKYCVAVAVLYPGVPANPWRPALRAYFGAPDARHPLWEGAWRGR
ncbi:polyphosphate polymerase domain-containing protein [Actinomadura sp. WMMB 499]|uniref:polyphosphate polymerase domain-containing protein n=1 Tax=Actinomadura sp. WMMB 499 TaxID=1219491 RepID=UPI001245221F|nr:polyphosphate polymerase domain-containing protein [Actinomadura sp. WMMB 499]QFG21937.1 polyphosphate polymerase domain-containing protein [Actinomadura sp. WMMB 499]